MTQAQEEKRIEFLNKKLGTNFIVRPKESKSLMQFKGEMDEDCCIKTRRATIDKIGIIHYEIGINRTVWEEIVRRLDQLKRGEDGT